MTEKGDHKAARDHYLHAVEQLPGDAETIEPEFVALLHDGLGRALQNCGQFSAAEEHLRSGLRIRSGRQGEDSRTRLAISEGHLGLLLLLRGRYAEAERLLRSALARTPPNRNDLLAHRHDCLGRYFLAIRAHQRAAAEYEKAIVHASVGASDNDPLVFDLRTNLALCRFRGGEADGALTEVSELLDASPGSPLRRAGLLNLSATIRASLGDLETAESQLAEALDAVTRARGENHPAVASYLANLGAIRMQGGTPDAALGPLRRAAAILRDDVAGHHQALVEILYKIAACLLESAPPEQARKAVTEARQAAHELTGIFTRNGSERALLTFHQQVDLHSIVCRLGDPALIADSLLNGKGRIMEVILERRSRDLERDLHAGRLRRELDALLLRDKAESASRVADLRLQIRGLDVEGAATHAPVKEIRWQEVANVLPPGTVFVDCVRYTPPGDSAGEARFGAILLDSGGPPRWVPLAGERMMGRLALLHRSLRTRADILRKGEGRAGLPMAPLLTDLHEAFWNPIAEALPGNTRELIICPEGQMHLLPFAVLRHPDGKFLCEMTTGPRIIDSGRALLRKSSPPVDNGNPWIALGVSDFSPHRKRAHEATARWSADWAGKLLESGDLPTVPEELLTLKRLSPEGSRALLNAEANESVLRGMTAPPPVLHFASHGAHVPLDAGRDLSANPAALYESAILLGLGGDGHDDGLLFPEEIAALNLQGTRLVTLSTCRSAIGRPVSGEGVLGLRRALAKAGARHILSSLWEIPDRSTARLMAGFYRQFAAGKAPGPLLWGIQAERFRALREKGASEDEWETAILSYGGFLLTSPRG
jgi:tetratricopeptide (TPR) repeat protein